MHTMYATRAVYLKGDDFMSKVAKSSEDAAPLIEAGFEYVCTTPRKPDAVQEA